MKIFEMLQPEVRRALARKELARRGPNLGPDLSQLTSDEQGELATIRARIAAGDAVPELARREGALLNLSGLRRIGIFLPDNGR